MKTLEKLEYINSKLEILNKRLKKRTFKVKFENKGTNNYCLVMKDELYKFNTYDDLMNCLNFIDDMFEMSVKEIEESRK